MPCAVTNTVVTALLQSVNDPNHHIPVETGPCLNLGPEFDCMMQDLWFQQVQKVMHLLPMTQLYHASCVMEAVLNFEKTSLLLLEEPILNVEQLQMRTFHIEKLRFLRAETLGYLQALLDPNAKAVKTPSFFTASEQDKLIAHYAVKNDKIYSFNPEIFFKKYFQHFNYFLDNGYQVREKPKLDFVIPQELITLENKICVAKLPSDFSERNIVYNYIVNLKAVSEEKEALVFGALIELDVLFDFIKNNTSLIESNLFVSERIALFRAELIGYLHTLFTCPGDEMPPLPGINTANFLSKMSLHGVYSINSSGLPFNSLYPLSNLDILKVPEVLSIGKNEDFFQVPPLQRNTIHEELVQEISLKAQKMVYINVLGEYKVRVRTLYSNSENLLLSSILGNEKVIRFLQANPSRALLVNNALERLLVLQE